MKHFTFQLLVMAVVMPLLHSQEPEDISSHIKAIIESADVPALVAAAALDGNIVSYGAAGVRKKGDPTPVTMEDKFHIGSCTKSMTATLGAMLIEDGKLQWNTTVSEVFPNLDVHEDYKNVTFEQFVTNTAGVLGDIQSDLWSSLMCPEETGQDILLERVLTNEEAKLRYRTLHEVDHPRSDGEKLLSHWASLQTCCMPTLTFHLL